MRLKYFCALLVLIGFGGAGRSTSAPTGSIADELPFSPFQWKVITVSVNFHDGTTSTLYGNDLAVHTARDSAQPVYPAGAVLALVTWSETPDDHWFGARIPGEMKSIEFVSMEPGSDQQPLPSYQKFAGSPLRRVDPAPGLADSRAAYIAGQRAAFMP